MSTMSNEEKRKKRLENKKRKIEAFLAVAELNDSEKKKIKTEGSETSTASKDENKPELKPKIFGEELQDLKQKLRERKRLLRNLPMFKLKCVGEESLLQQQKEKRVPLFMSDLQALITYCLCGDKAPYWPHRWCTLQKWNRLSNIVCVILEGLTVEHLEQRREEFPWLTSTLDMMEIISPASYDSSVAEDLALIPISHRQRSKLIEDFGSLETAMEKNEAVSTVKAIFPVVRDEGWEPGTSLKLRLLLSARQLVVENYPLPLDGVREKFQGFQLTKEEYKEVHDNSPLYSIDCEMCLTEGGMELARICVVNEQLEVVYHSLVQPEKQIVNYLTRYSGITDKLLENVQTRLSDVQAALKELLPPDCILVGQSLNSDLNALKMMHPYVIDTSVIFNITGDRRRKTKLATLANMFLNTEIQSSGFKGHSPEEDAKAAMNLVLLKLREGYHYGDVLLGGQVPGIQDPALGEQDPAPGQGDQDTDKQGFLLKEALASTLSKTARSTEKTVSVTVSSSCASSYLKLKQFKAELTLFQTGESYKEVLEKGKTGAVEHNLSISHLNLNDVKAEKVCRKAEKFCRELFEHTSSNGLFVVILPGSKEANASAGLRIVRPQLQN